MWWKMLRFNKFNKYLNIGFHGHFHQKLIQFQVHAFPPSTQSNQGLFWATLIQFSFFVHTWFRSPHLTRVLTRSVILFHLQAFKTTFSPFFGYIYNRLFAIDEIRFSAHCLLMCVSLFFILYPQRISHLVRSNWIRALSVTSVCFLFWMKLLSVYFIYTSFVLFLNLLKAKPVPGI